MKMSKDPVSNSIISGKWENEIFSKIPYKTYRSLNRSPVLSCHFCFNDQRFISGSENGKVQLWNLDSGEVVSSYAKHKLHVTNCKVFFEDKWILSSSYDTSICVSDVETEQTVWKSYHPGLATSCDVSQDDKLVVSCSDLNYSLYFWDFRNGKSVHRVEGQHESSPLQCKFSPDCKRVASAGMDNKTKIYDLISHKTTITLSGHQNTVADCCFSNNQYHLTTASWDKTLRIWDISVGQFRSTGSQVLKDGHIGSVSSCKFFNNNNRIVSGGYDKNLIIWDTKDIKKITSFGGHEGWINYVDITSNDKYLLSASSDNTVRLWDITKLNSNKLVIDANKSSASKVLKCDECGKPYRLSQSLTNSGICVFCQISKSNKILPTI